ncbi:MAG TPA: hypothetical protein VLN91_00935 [Nitrospirota bacterium]|nr:hypothetical protein [Nitrospirota bacterium]
MKAAAGVGITGLERIIFGAVMAFSKRNLESFDNVEQAKQWLENQFNASPGVYKAAEDPSLRRCLIHPWEKMFTVAPLPFFFSLPGRRSAKQETRLTDIFP